MCVTGRPDRCWRGLHAFWNHDHYHCHLLGGGSKVGAHLLEEGDERYRKGSKSWSEANYIDRRYDHVSNMSVLWSCGCLTSFMVRL